MRRLTAEERELLSVYLDRECTPEQKVEAEMLLAASPEAAAWLDVVHRARRLALAANRAGNGSVDLSRVTGERVAAAANRRRFHVAHVRGALLSLVAIGLLTAAFFLVRDDAPTDRVGDVKATLISGTMFAGNTAADLASSLLVDDQQLSGQERDEPASIASEKEVRSFGIPFKEDQKVIEESDRPEPQEVDASETYEASPLHLSINLHHSSAKVIIGDDQWSDTLRFSDAEDQVIALSTRISALTDSLNSDVARIAADTSRSARDRADEILVRQMEYESEVARELQNLRKEIDADERDPFDGACIETPAVTGLS